MPIHRFFYEKGALDALSKIELDGSEFHHLVHVTRTKEGESIELVDGKGCLAQATVIKKDKSIAILKINHYQKVSPPPFSLILLQALPRLNRLEMIVEKGTELGMTELWLFPGKFSETTQLKETQIKRLEKITIAALKQCGRLYLPKITSIPSLQQWDSTSFPLFFGDLSENQSLLRAWMKVSPQKGAILCIGPESGFHAEELAKFRSLGGKGVKLHSNTLRTDTAPIAALAIVGQMLLEPL